MQELKKAGSLEQGLMKRETDNKKNGRKKKTETT
jgi:hypothetical protein